MSADRSPDIYSFRELPADDQAQILTAEVLRQMRSRGATFCRITIVSADYPKPPYPHGLYFEGWFEQPDPQPEFNYPLFTWPIALSVPPR